jgi:hypothetical protein
MTTLTRVEVGAFVLIPLMTKKLTIFMHGHRQFVTESGKLTTEEAKIGTEETRPAEDKISDVRSVTQ